MVNVAARGAKTSAVREWDIAKARMLRSDDRWVVDSFNARRIEFAGRVVGRKRVRHSRASVHALNPNRSAVVIGRQGQRCCCSSGCCGQGKPEEQLSHEKHVLLVSLSHAQDEPGKTLAMVWPRTCWDRVEENSRRWQNRDSGSLSTWPEGKCGVGLQVPNATKDGQLHLHFLTHIRASKIRFYDAPTPTD